MNQFLFIIYIIIGIVAFYNTALLFLIRFTAKKIDREESEAIELFFSKVNKIPGIVEIMKKYSRHPDVFEDIIYLHKLGIIYSIESIYDFLELNSKIHREFQFLMKLSAKIPELHKDGNFLYMRSHVIFYENALEKKIMGLNKLFVRYNRLIKLKNLSIFGFFLPIRKKILI